MDLVIKSCINALCVAKPHDKSINQNGKLIPFLCYAKENVEIVRQLTVRLKAEDWIDPWLDEEDILPGQKWEDRVVQAVHESHAVIVFLSKIAVESEGFFHKELTLALDTAEEKPKGKSLLFQSGSIFVMCLSVYPNTSICTISAIR